MAKRWTGEIPTRQSLAEGVPTEAQRARQAATRFNRSYKPAPVGFVVSYEDRVAQAKAEAPDRLLSSHWISGSKLSKGEQDDRFGKNVRPSVGSIVVVDDSHTLLRQHGHGGRLGKPATKRVLESRSTAHVAGLDAKHLAAWDNTRD